jgi:hypothetical protein
MPSLPHPAAAVLERMYAAYLDGDRSAIDSVLDQNLTMFDSAHRELIVGLDDLNAVRASRGPVQSTLRETALTMTEVRAIEHGELVMLLFGLRVDFAEPGSSTALTISPELSRNTAVLRHDPERGWIIVHLHEDVIDAGGQRLLPAER